MAQTPATEHTAPQRLAIEDTVVVAAPVREVYQQWSDFSRFPEFMRTVISVTPIGENRYHWVASFFGQRQEWDTEVTAREEQRHVAWKCVSGENHSGDLTFTPQDDTATEVRLHMELATPEGLAPQRFDKLAQSARKNAHNGHAALRPADNAAAEAARTTRRGARWHGWPGVATRRSSRSRWCRRLCRVSRQPTTTQEHGVSHAAQPRRPPPHWQAGR